MPAEESFRLTLPEVGRPYRNDASCWPIGDAAAVSVATTQLCAKL